MEGSFRNFQGMSGMAKTTSDSILGVIRKKSWILVFGFFHHWQIRETAAKYGNATWRTSWRWRRFAVFDCFSSYCCICLLFGCLFWVILRPDSFLDFGAL